MCAERLSRSIPSSRTSSGTLPTACVASVWKTIPRVRQSRPISATGLIVPTSLLAAITETRTVRSVSAAGDGLGRDQAVRVGGEDGHVPALAGQAIQRVEHGLVLGRRGDEVVPLRSGAPAGPL